MFDFKAQMCFKLNMGLIKQLSYFSVAHKMTQIICWIHHLALKRCSAARSSPMFMQQPPATAKDMAKRYLSWRNMNKCLFLINTAIYMMA